MEALQHFANHTRHRPARDGGLTQLSRKWMITHVAPMSPETYAFVANDYALMEARTHSPPLASYADPNHPVDVETFVWIAKNGYPHDRPLTLQEEQRWPALAQFRDTLWPAHVDQEAWEPFERKDHWKERAYFLAAAGACKNRPQFHALVKAILQEDSTVTVDSISDLYTRILRAIPEPNARELGTLIGALDLTHLDAEQQGGPSCEAARQEYLKGKEEDLETEITSAAAPVSPIILVNTDNAAIETKWEDIRNDSSVIAFRERELIPPTFATQKVVQQMILTHLGVPIPTELLSSAQRRNQRQPVGPVLLGQGVFDWIASIPHDELIAHLDLECPQLQSYYFGRSDGSAGQPMSPQALVQGIIQDERHRKLWPIIETSIIKALIKI